MKFARFSLVFAALILFIPSVTYAQKAASAAWNPFWSQFTAAVNSKNKAAVKRLMASENDFSSGGGVESRDEWLQLVDKSRWWGLLQKSVRSGTRTDNYNGQAVRVTKDNHLTFRFIRGKWRFTGPMGD